MERRIQLLDSTLRDGGLGFEDAEKSGLSAQHFDEQTVQQIVNCLYRARINIIELGSIQITSENMQRFAIYQSIEDISQKILFNQDQNQMFAALYRGPDTPIEDIPEWNPSYCKAVRVILRYSELDKSLNFCEALSKKGYQVFVQPMLTMRYTEQELQQVIHSSNEMGAYAVYFVDSYGYMQDEDVVSLFKKYDSGLDPNIRIGFHAHNNMNLAFSNAKILLAQQSERKIIIDACALGLGQGAGNLQMEIITDYINRCYDYNYDYSAVLELCEVIEKYWVSNTWGYSLVYYLPARHRAAYKYSTALRYRYGLSYVEIDSILGSMPKELRQRYTVENVTRVIKEYQTTNNRIFERWL